MALRSRNDRDLPSYDTNEMSSVHWELPGGSHSWRCLAEANFFVQPPVLGGPTSPACPSYWHYCTCLGCEPPSTCSEAQSQPRLLDFGKGGASRAVATRSCVRLVLLVSFLSAFHDHTIYDLHILLVFCRSDHNQGTYVRFKMSLRLSPCLAHELPC